MGSFEQLQTLSDLGQKSGVVVDNKFKLFADFASELYR
jgi:hypothetical protein